MRMALPEICLQPSAPMNICQTYRAQNIALLPGLLVKSGMLKLYLLVLVILALSLCVACSEVERSASHAFDNANSVLKSGRNVAFGNEPAPAPTPASDRRY